MRVNELEYFPRVLLILCPARGDMHLIFTKSIIDQQNVRVIKLSWKVSLKPTMDLIDEQILVAVHSIENASQDSDSQEVINLTRNGSICRANTNICCYFELGH